MGLNERRGFFYMKANTSATGVWHTRIYWVLLGLLTITASQCTNTSNTGKKQDKQSDSLAIRQSIQEAPVLSGEEAIDHMRVEEGFEVKLVAAEPLVTAPVCLSFDSQGRMWVVEMQGYMPDTLGTGEQVPDGKVVILTDKDGDGAMDERIVFLDSLVLPRALCLIEGGILVAEPPYLWYYDIVNDQPANRRLVDSNYAEGGNVEHQPNGLLRAMDNWIYSAKSSKRYRKQGNTWLQEPTHFRGQWGIAESGDGRLLYNTNSENVLGDFFLPGFGASNPHQQQVAGFNESLVPDTRVYPARPTPGVNRGYVAGVLDDSLRLTHFTAACGPVMYLGNLFDSRYQGNVFVAEPAGNLIKRNILHSNGYRLQGEQAYAGKEFIASYDERFRPVNLCNGPDGALYITDMYRGIIQHLTYLTPYLKQEIKARNLTRPLNCGRIYKVVPTGKTGRPVTFSNNSQALTALLQHPNGWVRSQAQQLLVDKNDPAAIEALRQLLTRNETPYTLAHALWALEGLHALTVADVLPLMQSVNWPVRMQALGVLPAVIDKKTYPAILPLLMQMARSEDTLAAPYLAFLANALQPYDARKGKDLLMTLIKKYPGNRYVADAVISNLYGQEDVFYKKVIALYPDTTLVINRQLKEVLEDIQQAANNSNMKQLAARYPKGARLYTEVCQTCHGPDGNGIVALAPPLNKSGWVQGSKHKLAAIVLYGLTGPVEVGGKTYRAPEISGEMPGLGANPAYTNEDIAQVLSFIRQAWGNDATPLVAAEVSSIRSQYKGRQAPFTADELNKIK